MDLVELFRSACEELQARNVQFAVAGGFAAVLYRDEDRLTNDIDFAILSDSKNEQIAEQIFERLGLDRIQISRIADLEGGPMFAIKSKSTPPAILIGRKSTEDKGPGVDFILPTVPWVASALLRAVANQVDFGFGKVPTLTIEDVIVAKLYARKGNYRPKDEDDLLSIFAANHQFDFDYLNAQMAKFGLPLPKTIRDKAPPILIKISKTVEKQLRSQKMT
ncbi:MAG: nucleotidyl transferase AbiEii/AbiGii toxin family protein [Bdellovibrionota bacterium]